MRNLAAVGLLAASMVVPLLSCGDDGVVEPPGVDSLAVTTLTLGDTLDADGYQLIVDGAVSQIGMNETRTFEDLATGEHSIELDGVAVNCAVSQPNPRTVSVRDDAATQVVFDVDCVASLFAPILFDDKDLEGSDVYVMDADGQNPVNLTGDRPSYNGYPSFSPGSTHIAFQSLRDGNEEIYVMDADGQNPVRLTDNPARDLIPRWSPDGTRIAFMSNRDGDFEIYVMDFDGQNTVQLTDNTDWDGWPSWAPDSERIVFTTSRHGNLDIYSMGANGSNPERLTTSSYRDDYPSVSPDGTKVAFSSDRHGSTDLFVMDADGRNVIRLTDDFRWEINPCWTPLGRQIVYQRVFTIYVVQAHGSHPVRLTENTTHYRHSACSPADFQP